jgi:hypothetical protein
MTNKIVELNQKEIAGISGGDKGWVAAKFLIFCGYIGYHAYKPEWLSWNSTMSFVGFGNTTTPAHNNGTAPTQTSATEPTQNNAAAPTHPVEV